MLAQVFNQCLCNAYRFKDQIHDVFKMLSADVQVILLSATMPDDVLEVSRCFMRDPVRILVQKEEVSLLRYIPYNKPCMLENPLKQTFRLNWIECILVLFISLILFKLELYNSI